MLMKEYRLSDLLDMSLIQKLADSNFLATGLPMSIIDAFDTSVLVRAGWTDICVNFHRANILSSKRCNESDDAVKDHLFEGEVYKYRCKNGLWHVAMPIFVAKRHLGTMFLSQFYFEGEVPERAYFVRQADEFGYDRERYLTALDRLPVFSVEKVDYIIAYDRALVRFISDLAEQSIRIIETKEALRKSEEQYRTLVDNVNIGVYRNTRDGRFLQANPALARIFGYASVAEFMAVPATDLYLNKDDRKSFIYEIMQAGFVKDRELQMKKKDGTPIICSMTSNVQYDEEGGIKWVDGVVEDITERKKAEEAIHKLNEELEQRVVERTRQLESTNVELKSAQSRILQQEKMASIGQLAAGVAHEINNPMGFIISNLSSLGRYMNKIVDFMHLQSEAVAKLALQEEMDRSEIVNGIVERKKAMKLDFIMSDLGNLIRESLDGADRVKKIVQDLKTFSRLDDFEFKMANINDGLDSTITIAWNELKYKAALKKEYGDIPVVMCNLGQLNQVFMNILLNAAQAITAQGVITVKTWSDGSCIYISISDTGAGIPAGKINRIFEPFYTTKDVGQGTGLGLSIAYDIIKKHNGEIRVESKVGQGTTFTIIVPIVNG